MDYEETIRKLRYDLEQLRAEVYRGNFSASQTFPKYSNFTSRLKVPHYSTLPSSCDVGEIAEAGGKLYICATANNWAVVGNQSA